MTPGQAVRLALVPDGAGSGCGLTAGSHGSFQLANILCAANRICILVQGLGNKANRAEIAALAFRRAQHNADNVDFPAIR